MTSSNYCGSSQVNPWGGLDIVVIGILLTFACFGLFGGMVLWRLIGRRTWSLYAWVPLGLVGAATGYYVYRDGSLVHAMVIQIVTALREFEHLQVNLGTLWIVTLPVWLRTLCIAPFVGIVQVLFQSKSAEDQLLDPLRQLQVRWQRTAGRAKRRVRNPRKVPDQIDGFGVLGVPMEDK